MEMDLEDDIAEKLRKENPEQFLILVRMHLSFIIDMNTDENDSPNDKPKFKWGFSKKIKNLTNENSNKNSLGPNKVSEIFLITDENVNQLYQLIDILSMENNVCQEGIFRRTGSLSRQQQLRKLLSLGGDLSKEGSEDITFNVHDMASVLKGILADTPEPLLLNQNYQAYCHLAASNFSDGHVQLSNENRLVDALRLLLLLLPALDRCLAKRLLFLLHKTSLHEKSNRMSPSALSTMFTPHVMCHRRLSPETLHADSQVLAPILTFMIERAPLIFVTPPQLATDIAAYLSRRQQRKLLSPNGEDLNESVSEHTAANTVFTFVDRQMSGVEVKDGSRSTCSTSVTDTALAQLYAHIQALPESQNKKRLIKQFNRENGYGTPLQLQRAQKQKSISQSLKKHIFNKNLMSKAVKKSLLASDQGFGYQSISESPSACKPNQKDSTFDCIPIDISKSNETISNTPIKLDIVRNIHQKSSEMDDLPKFDHSPSLSMTPHLTRKKDTNLLLTSTPQVTNILLTTDMVGNCSTPIISNHTMKRGSMSPITKSTQKMPKSMQESIMTPRSRKPVIISCDPPISTQRFSKDQEASRDSTSSSSRSYRSSSISSSSSVSLKNDSDFVSTDESCPSTSYCIKYKRIENANTSKHDLASSPYSSLANEELTMKKRRIFQESFCNSSNTSDCHLYNLDQSDSELINNKLLEASGTKLSCSSNRDDKTVGLSEPFRQYLLCRSILTKSPVDLSFITESDDTESLNIDNLQNLSEDKMTASLLYFLDGNGPENLSSSDYKNFMENQNSCELKCNKMLRKSPNKMLPIDKENINPSTKSSI